MQRVNVQLDTGAAEIEHLKLRNGRVGCAACWAHSRRKFYDLLVARPSTVATEALRRIGATITSSKPTPDVAADLGCQARPAQARPLLDDFERLPQYEYDGVGHLKRILASDGSSISYSYDDAQRLIGIADSLGDSISCTLDAIGNRTAKRGNDPNGILARQPSVNSAGSYMLAARWLASNPERTIQQSRFCLGT
jgi:YD repeat-containing protein